FKGLHTYVKLTDGISDSATGEEAAKAKWKTDQAKLAVFPGVYDLAIEHSNSSVVIDNVNCVNSDCQTNVPTANLKVLFPGMSKVHTYVKQPDGNNETASGAQVAKATWKTDAAELQLLPGIYDVLIEFGAASQVINNVDCSRQTCEVDLSSAELTVNFPDMKSVHTYVMKTDGEPGTANGEQVTKAKWKTDLAQLTVLPGVYDLLIEHGVTSQVIDNVNCSNGKCTVDVPIVVMQINFPGMTSVHSYVKLDDRQSDTATGEQVAKSKWKKESTQIKIFPGIYDLEIKRGPMTQVIDQIDRRSSATCQADAVINTIRVHFEGMKAVHTSVRMADESDNEASGTEANKLNWQTDMAELMVFPGVYDLLLRKGETSFVVDKLDCQTDSMCEVNDITATLTAEFPGLSSVHTKVSVPDGVAGTATGGKVTHLNYQKQHAVLTTFRQIYDVEIDHQVNTVFDDVDCRSGVCSVLVEGNVQSTLMNGDLNTPIADIRMTAYEKLADGSLQKAMQGTTNAKGQINFTLEGMDQGRIYVLKAHNPLDNRKHYYSAFITQEGPYQFIVTADGSNELDLLQPELVISQPAAGGFVPHLGFDISGFATDNQEIDRVTVTINDPLKGVSLLNANFDQQGGSWNLRVDQALISENQTITINVTAYDRSQNQRSVSITVQVVKDLQGPQIDFTSHSENDDVPVTGFLLSGTVTDQTGVEQLTVSLTDPVLGTTIQNRLVDVSTQSGTWSLIVDNNLMTQGQTVSFAFTAVDVSGNSSQRTLQLRAVAVDFSAAQLINRTTFGATPELLTEIEAIGVQNYLSQQLNPNSIDDSVFNSMLGTSNPVTKQDLQSWTLMHMVYSRKQLQEVMTWFWDNHFNTNINTRSMDANGMEQANTVAYELAENQAFRANALGNFRTLLGISAKSPSMLIYLDNISNIAADSNENYTREAMELHTMGVDGGYTTEDVRAGAEIFTGWHLQNGQFFFNSAQHASADHVVLGVDIPAGGIEQGEQFLDIVANHPSTAGFICTKLVTLLVNDDPPTNLVTRCTNKFLQTTNDVDQIAQVVDLIVQSAEFYDPANYRAKIKSPVEFVVTAVRHLDAQTSADDLIAPIAAMGIRLYENPVPTGWSEIGEDWINAGLLVERLKWVNQLARELPNGSNTVIDPLSFYPQYGFETAEGITGFLLQLSLDTDITDLARQQALDVLGTTGFDLSNPDAEDRLRQLTGSVLSFPQYQFQ
nr:DUF1800 domain-containing protein [Gammaproteobacteria bacterium]